MKRLLPILWALLFFALAFYLGLTYVVSVPLRPTTAEGNVFVLALQAAGAVDFLAGLVIERIMLGRAKTPGEVQSAWIVSAALGEAIAIYGLVAFFQSGVRHWEFFAVAAVYLVGLLLRLPEFNAKIDATTQT